MATQIRLGANLVNVNGITSGTSSITSSAVAPYWTRPADWLAIPTTGSQEFCGLYAVYSDSNYVALSATTNNSYSVDWGDGTSSYYSSSATAEYSHNYTTISTSSYCSRGYRQCYIRITPSGSANLYSVNLQKKHSRAGLPAVPNTNWLEHYVNGNNLTSIIISQQTPVANMGILENVQLNNYSSSYLAPKYLFYNCIALQNVYFVDTSKWVSSFSTMFLSCTSLERAPEMNTQSGSRIDSLFYVGASGLSKLKYVPTYNTSNVTDFSNAFNYCSAMTSFPLLDTSKGTTFNGMYRGTINCKNVDGYPALNTQSGSNFGVMFSNHTTLEIAPYYNTMNATTIYQMFYACYALQTVPLYNTSKVTDFSQMFQGCASLKYVPAFDARSGSNFASFVNSCPNLTQCDITGSRYTIDYSGCSLSRTALVNIFNNLGTAIVSGSTSITCSANHGVADLTAPDIAIANNKGYMVKTT